MSKLSKDEFSSLDDEEPLIKFLHSNLNTTSNNIEYDFKLTREQAMLSGLFKTIIENSNFTYDEVIPVTNDFKIMSNYAYKMCMNYLQYHNGTMIPLPSKPLRSVEIEKLWDSVILSDSMKIKIEHDINLVKKIYQESIKCDKLYEVIEAANYLDIKGLLNMGAIFIATLCKKHNVEDFEKIFGI